MFTFSNIKAITNLTQNYSNFTAKYSGVNYTYVKPKIGLSLNLALAQLKSGRLFGSGPNEFYKVWQKDKPQSVVDSNFWSTEFVNSYSALTTLLVTLGIVGTATIIMIIVGITLTLKNKLKTSKEDENYKFNEENKFYLYSTSALFIFSILIFIFFTDVANAIILLAIASVFATNLIVNYRLSRNNRAHFLLFVIILIIVFLSSRVVIRKAKAAKLINLSIASYQQDNKINNLENNILKAINLDKSDVNYRLLTNFYLLKTQNILSKVTSSSSKDEINNIQNEATENITKALDSANTAIAKDKEDYNNYLTLGSVYSFLINTNANNREANYQAAKSAYTKATNLYPKNPSTYLTLAQLEYEYDKNSTSTKSSLDQSLKVKPNYSEAYYIYSQLALENNDKDSALKYALQAIQTNPNNLNAYLQYGILTISKNNLSKDDLNNAYLAFATALQLDPNNLLAGYYLGITYTLAGQYDKAQDIVNALDKVIPNNEKISELQKFLNSNKSSLNSINSSSDSSSTKKIDIKDKE